MRAAPKPKITKNKLTKIKNGLLFGQLKTVGGAVLRNSRRAPRGRPHLYGAKWGSQVAPDSISSLVGKSVKSTSYEYGARGRQSWQDEMPSPAVPYSGGLVNGHVQPMSSAPSCTHSVSDNVRLHLSHGSHTSRLELMGWSCGSYTNPRAVGRLSVSAYRDTTPVH